MAKTKVKKRINKSAMRCGSVAASAIRTKKKESNKKNLQGFSFFKKKEAERKEFARQKNEEMNTLSPAKTEKALAWEKKNRVDLSSKYAKYKQMVKNGLISKSNEKTYQQYALSQWIQTQR